MGTGLKQAPRTAPSPPKTPEPPRAPQSPPKALGPKSADGADEAAKPAAPSTASSSDTKNGGVHSQRTSYTTAAPANPFAQTAKSNSRADSMMKFYPDSLKNAVNLALAPLASSARLRSEAQAGRKLESGSLAVSDFDAIGAGKTRELVAKMASGNAKQRQNLAGLMDDPEFAKHLGTALDRMEPSAGMKVLDSLYKTKPPSDQVAATLHVGLNAMDPAKRGALMKEAAKSADPDAKEAVEGYQKAKLDSGKLEASDFESLSPGNAAGLVAALARGGIDQKENLAKLMADPRFAKHLTTVLNNDKLPLAERAEVIKASAEIKDPAASRTLQAALDGMAPSQRNEMLREGLTGKDSRVLEPLNRYLTAKPAAAAEFLKSTTSQDIDDKNLSLIFKGMNPASLSGALKSLSAGSTEDAQNVFKRLGDAVNTSKEDGGIRKQLVTALDDMPAASRASLLQKIIADQSGNQSKDKQVNFGQHFVAQYLERKGPEGVKKFLDSIAPANPMANAPKLNPNDPKSFQAHNDYATKVAQDRANQMRGKLESFIQKNGLNDEGPDTSRARDRIGNLTSGGIGILDYNPQKAMILGQLKQDPSRIIRDMDAVQLKSMVKVFMKDGDMGALGPILKDLSPQSAAKLANVVKMAASETKAEVNAGSFLGDLVGGMTKAGMSGKEVMDGAKTRAGNDVQRSLNDFSLAWGEHLKGMSPNDKQLFLDTLGTPHPDL